MLDHHQEKILAALARPDFYPHAVKALKLHQTHISIVALTGSYAYKIKKPVNLEFLDFTSLAKRKYYCRREVILNRRASAGVYLGVVPITFDGDRYHLAGAGKPVEYAVKMRQLPDKLAMLQLLRRGNLDRNAVAKLARVLAQFHQSASTDGAIDSIGGWSTIKTNVEENFRQTEPFVGNFIDLHMFQIIKAATRSFLMRHKPLFDRRVKQKKIRDCHGDLRTEHIYFADGIQIIDCIEFNDRFRYSDITSDLAFLTMDLDYEDYPLVAQELLSDYLLDTKDEEMLLLMDFYKCYRAYIRAKVNCFYLQACNAATGRRKKLLAQTRRYLDLAYRYAVQFTRPSIWVVCGLPAAGKTSLAEALSKILGVGILHSDIVRKQLFGLPPDSHHVVPFEEGIYSEQSTALVYGKLLMMAQEEIEKGDSIILDATFARCHQRDEALRLARDLDANIVFVECTASDKTIAHRLSIRGASPSVSDARRHHFGQIRKRFEPFTDVPAEMHIGINTEISLPECLQQILSHDYVMLAHQATAAMESRAIQ